MVVEIESSIAGHGFEVGDMVWADVKFSPWWPGHVYREELATPLVRQSKREGLLLVAFFGASSFGWFDSSELLPFDSNYAEKCRQTSSRAFVRAVEDAVAEVSRRSALGLSCMCRNKQSFREMDVPGFYSVDVAGYDPGAVYSGDAIGKARDSFQPKLTVDFLGRLALEPTVSEHVDIDFIRNMATVLSYRKAVYEDLDLAFGCYPTRASVQDPGPRETSSKAPLSGREVFADGLGKVKNTAKQNDHIKKDEYIFKRRDESEEIKKEKEVKKDGISLVDKISAKRTAQSEGPHKSDGNYETDVSRVLGDLLSLAVDPSNTANKGPRIKGKKAFLRFRSLVFQKSKNFSPALISGEPSDNKSSVDSVEVPPVKPQGGFKRGLSDLQEEMAVAKRKKVEDIRDLTKEKKVIKIKEPPVQDVKQPITTTLKKAVPELIKKTEQRVTEPTMLMIKFPQGGSLPPVSELNAKFVRYGPMDHSATQIFQNTFLCRVVFRHKAHAQAAYNFVAESNSLFGNTGVKCSLKEVGDVDAAEPEPPIEVSKEDHHQPAIEDRSPSMVSATSGVQVKSILKISGGEEAAGNDSLGKVMNTTKPKDHAEKEETGLSRVLSDLHSLAVDPFNTVNRGSQFKVKRAFLKFRSLVFQKSQNFSLPLAAGEPNSRKSSVDSVEVPPVKPQGGLKQAPSDLHEEMAAAKKKKLPLTACEPNSSKSSVDSVEVSPVKPQGGLKRAPSDLHEEMAAAKKKKVGDVRNLTKEKKVTKKIDEPAADIKQPVATLKKPGPEFIKKTEQRAHGPTMLMIKFPQGGSLPSYKELKARFASYGPLDHSGTHIFWNTSSCQVLFKHKAHALAAYRFVFGSSSLFGNKGVKCSLKAVETVDQAQPGPPIKVPKEDHHQPDMVDRPPSMVPDTSGVQLKSILKKSEGEEAAGGGGKGRVKFMLGGDDSRTRNNMGNKSGATSFSSSHLTMDSTSKNFQKAVHSSVVTSPSPPSMHYGTTLLAPTSSPPVPSPSPPPPRSMLMTTLRVPNTDIAEQMLSLLTRCNDVVMDISSILGYTPYHPL